MTKENMLYLVGIITYVVLFVVIIALVDYFELNSGNVAIAMILWGFMIEVIKTSIEQVKSDI